MNRFDYNTIDLESAAQMTAAWRTFVNDNAIDPHLKQLRGFLIPDTDLSSVLGEGAVSCRVYLAYDPQVPRGLPFKLVVVGVDAAGADILTHVYDFTNPCPDSCGNSILCPPSPGKPAEK